MLAMEDSKKLTGRGGWRGGGRPKGSGSGPKKTAKLNLTCTPEQKKEVERRAADAGSNTSKWAMKHLLPDWKE